MNEKRIIDLTLLSGDELESRLCAELESSDPAAALELMEELSRREAEDSANTQAAWDAFNQHYLPLEGADSLYAPEETPKKRTFRLARAFSAAAAAAMLACVLIVQAGGTSVLATMARWTTDRFTFGDSPIIFDESSLLPGSGSEDAAKQAASSSAPGADEAVVCEQAALVRTQYGSFAAGLEALGLSELLPSHVPEGYSFYQAELTESFGWTDLSVLYTDAEENLLQFRYSRVSPGTVSSTIVEKDTTPVDLYERDGVTYYFVTNLDYESVNWKPDELTECRVSGFVSREELKAVIDSMYD